VKKTLCSAILMGMVAPLLAGAAELRMPEEPLGTSLQELATLNSVHIVFAPNVVDGRQAPALNGKFTVEGALDTLLAGTGLTYHLRSTQEIEIVGTPMDEVEITGSYEKLSVMRKEYEKVEDQFYEEYNELNTNPQYEVSCSEGESHNARLAFSTGGRNCVPRFVNDAQRDEAMGFLGDAFGGGHPTMTAALIIRQKTPDYQKNMVALVNKNPKLLELLMKRSALAQRYEVVRKKKFAGGKVFVWD
jgi:hypothetical protein